MSTPGDISFPRTPFTRSTERRVRDYIRRREVFRAGEAVVVGLSGGPDSTALSMILSRLAGELGLCLTAAHFDHRLRSREEAAGDLAFCEQLSQSLRVSLAAGHGNVASRVRRLRETTEEAARNLRYRFLAREAKTCGATKIAVGHTMDDQAETVLLHVLRGSGLDGLAAMPPLAPWPFGRGPEIARPLLTLSRGDTERYCRDSGIEPRRDPTNDTPIAMRNRVRRELMPVLHTFNLRAEEALARLAEAAADDTAFIDEFTGAAWRSLAERDGEAVVLQKKLAKLPRAIVSRVLLRAFREASAGAAEIDGEHLRGLAEALGMRRSRMSLPGGLTAVIDAERLRIIGGEPPAMGRIPETPLAVPGKMHAGTWTIEVRVQARRASHSNDPLDADIDGGSVAGTLIVRSRKPGDRLRPLGLGGTKKVQDILVDAHVPQKERDAVPIVEDERGIVWIAGHCIDERVKLTPDTKQVIHIRLRQRT